MSADLFFNTTKATIDQMHETSSTLDWIMSKMDQFPIKISFFFSCAMVIGSIVPYIPQYFTIKQTQNTEGFSLYVCLTLLVANILRIMFWFGKHFETALLIQSIVMILTMFILLELCVRVRNSNLIIQQKRRYFTETILEKKNHITEPTRDNIQRSKSLDCCRLVKNDVDHEDNEEDRENGVDCRAKNIISKKISSSFSYPVPKNKNYDYSICIIKDKNNTSIEMMKEGVESQHQPRKKSSLISDPISSIVDMIHLPKGKNLIPSTQDNQNTQGGSILKPIKNIVPLRSVVIPKQTIVSSSDAGKNATVKLEDQCKIKSSLSQNVDQNNEFPMHNIHDHNIDNNNGQERLLAIKKHSINIDDDDQNKSVHVDAKIPETKKDQNQKDDPFIRKRFIDFNWRYFWEWTDFMSYLECMAVFTLIAGAIFYLFIDVPLVVEGYGLVALVTESLLASPQFIRNLKMKSTEGMSKLMVFCWFLGDLYKTIYFFVRDAPFQFLICGCIQITLDTLIFLQVICYKKEAYRKLSKSRLKHLENRARKRFETNIDTKKMINISAENNADESGSIVATSITVPHHPQPLSKMINDAESLDPISSSEHSEDAEMDLIELDGYDNRGAVFEHGRERNESGGTKERK